MNQRLEDFKNRIKSKNIAVVGLGVSNIPLVRFLSRFDTKVTVFDKSDREKLEPSINKLEGCKAEFCLGKDYLKNLKGFDIIFRTPSLRPDIPELIKEKSRGADITSEMEVFLELCPAKVFAVTGSDGKTTTTTLIYEILKDAGYKCWLGGNIGTPLLDRIDEISENDMVVLELSSFQLLTMKISPSVSIITNVSPNHLDIHKSMEEYIEAKMNIFRYQNSTDRLILNFDNETTRNMADNAKGKVSYFSRLHYIDKGVYAKEGSIYSTDGEREEKLLDTDEIAIPGVHNIENYMACIAAVSDYVKKENIKYVAHTFRGVEHRNEFVREINGVSFYNDSIGTSPTRTAASINSFKEKVILIAGGYDKKIPFEGLGRVILEKVKCLVLIGQTADKIEKSVLDAAAESERKIDLPIVKCDTLEDAVAKAFLNTVRGDVVLLSPASASFDMYTNFEERGMKFKEIVERMSV